VSEEAAEVRCLSVGEGRQEMSRLSVGAGRLGV